MNTHTCTKDTYTNDSHKLQDLLSPFRNSLKAPVCVHSCASLSSCVPALPRMNTFSHTDTHTDCWVWQFHWATESPSLPLVSSFTVLSATLFFVSSITLCFCFPVLIKLKKQDGRCVRRTQFIRPICLPDKNMTFPDDYCCAISGWGHMHESE